MPDQPTAVGCVRDTRAGTRARRRARHLAIVSPRPACPERMRVAYRTESYRSSSAFALA